MGLMMDEGAGCQTGRRMGIRERVWGGSSLSACPAASQQFWQERRGEGQVCCGAVPPVCARPLCLLTFAQEAAACLPCQTETKP